LKETRVLKKAGSGKPKAWLRIDFPVDRKAGSQRIGKGTMFSRAVKSLKKVHALAPEVSFRPRRHLIAEC
jgi:hypothetical protein